MAATARSTIQTAVPAAASPIRRRVDAASPRPRPARVTPATNAAAMSRGRMTNAAVTKPDAAGVLTGVSHLVRDGVRGALAAPALTW